MIREKAELLIFGNIFNCIGLFMHNLPLQLAGLTLIIWCLIICVYDHIRIKKIEKQIEQKRKELDEKLEKLREKFGSDDKDET